MSAVNAENLWFNPQNFAEIKKLSLQDKPLKYFVVTHHQNANMRGLDNGPMTLRLKPARRVSQFAQMIKVNLLPSHNLDV